LLMTAGEWPGCAAADAACGVGGVEAVTEAGDRADATEADAEAEAAGRGCVDPSGGACTVWRRAISLAEAVG
jgi:hypothetical protein